MTNVIKLKRHVSPAVIDKLEALAASMHQVAGNMRPSPQRDRILAKIEKTQYELQAQRAQAERLEVDHA